MKKIAVVTGGSSGIGLCTALSLVQKGCKVYTLSRRDFKNETMAHIKADVSKEEQVRAALKEVLGREGRIDILVNCAGFGISGASEFTENDDAKRLLEVNLFGTVNCCKAVIPAMRKQGSGTIVCVSSVAAPISIPFQNWYSLSKAAISAYCAALAGEGRPFGIKVCAVLPGDIHTDFTNAREKSPLGDDVYQGRISRSVAGMERDERSGMSPAAAGQFISKVALKKHPAPTYTIGLKYKLFVLLSRILPQRLVRRIVDALYG